MLTKENHRKGNIMEDTHNIFLCSCPNLAEESKIIILCRCILSKSLGRQDNLSQLTLNYRFITSLRLKKKTYVLVFHKTNLKNMFGTII